MFDQSWSDTWYWDLLKVTPWVLGLAFLLQDWSTDRQVATRQQTTSGIVIAHQPTNHDRYGYKFQVNGRTYTGWQSPMKGNELAIGKQVTVFYDPQDPWKNSLTDFHDVSTAQLGPAGILTIMIGAAAIIIFLTR